MAESEPSRPNPDVQSPGETDVERANLPQPRDVLAVLETAIADPSLFVPHYPREQVDFEEKRWKEINSLTNVALSADNAPAKYSDRQALASHFKKLGVFYAKAGDLDGAERFFTQSLTFGNDPQTALFLARTRGLSRSHLFIADYEKLLSEFSFFDTVLDYARFLELRGYHTAAVDSVEEFLKKNPNEPDVAEKISEFIPLIQSSGSLVGRVHVEDYWDIVRGETAPGVGETQLAKQARTVETIVGKTTTEIEPEFGPEDLAKQSFVITQFFFRHYAFQATTVSSAIILMLLAFSGVPAAITRWCGTIIFSSLLISQIITSAGLVTARSDLGSRKARQILIKLTVLGFVTFWLNLIGLLVFRLPDLILFSWLAHACGILGIASLIGIVVGTVQSLMRELGTEFETFRNRVTAKAYARLVAQLTANAAAFSALLYVLFLLGSVLVQGPRSRLLGLCKACFLVLCWWWAKLTSESRKQRLRYHILAVALVLFLIRVVGISYSQSDGWVILSSFNTDSVVLIGVMYSFFSGIFYIRTLVSVLTFGFVSLIELSPYLPPTIGKFIGQGWKTVIAISALNINSLIIIMLYLVLGRDIILRQVQNTTETKGGHMPARKRKPSIFEAVSLFLLAAVLVAILGILISGGGRLAALQLWMILTSFLIIMAFALPFALIALGVIDEKTWVSTFHNIAGKLPRFSFKPSEPNTTEDNTSRERREKEVSPESVDRTDGGNND